MKSLALKVGFCLALAWSGVALAQSSAESEAGDVSEVDKDALGPLRERVRPVSGHVFLKKGRFEVSPGVTFSVKDAFFTKYILGASLTFHPGETFGIGVRAGYGLNTISGAAQICEPNQGCRSPSQAEVDRQAPGQIQLLGGLDLQWAPIYGKISIISEAFLHFDLYGIIGPEVIQYVSRTGPTFTFGGNVGIGTRIFITRWMTLRFELRDLIYQEQTGFADSLRNQILFDLGFSFFFPTTFDQG
jgi:outer membrane beta-barrel protein